MVCISRSIAPSFNPCYSGSNSKIIGQITHAWNVTRVSILVIVEVTLKSLDGVKQATNIQSFNPCYSGSNSKIAEIKLTLNGKDGFNPCYSGSNSKISVS